MQVYLCEKPSQARDLAAVLGVKQRSEGYFHDGKGRVVTWALGHLLEMFLPDDYGQQYKSWSLETLPISPDNWQQKIRPAVAKQYKVVEKLLKKATTIFIATDFDREGEAIARTLMDRVGYKGEVKRVCLTALDETSIRKALAKVRDGDQTLPLYYAALARQRADWLIGMNISRLYTVMTRQVGFNETLHIGRVITPTVALVCERDLEIQSFLPVPYWMLEVDVQVQNGQFKALWKPPEECSDSQKRCINKAYAEQVAAQVIQAPALISKAETKAGKELAPLPFDLTSLQQYANKRWGYTAQKVLDAAQSLYETHKATSYPRTDSRYLPESQRSDIANVFQALTASDPSFTQLVAAANPKQFARVFNDKKTTAHHAIIPTPATANISAMSAMEFNLYDAIRRYYLAQFYPAFEFNQTKIEVLSSPHKFTASGKVPLVQGWKVLLGLDKNSSDKSNAEKNADKKEQKLPQIIQGESAFIPSGIIEDKLTKPPAHFTEATLLAAMENIARFVTEERFKKILRDTAGLGTPATRAGILQGAVDRGYFIRQKNFLLATEKAQALMAVLPASLKSAGMTAGWEQELEKIAAGEGDMAVFMVKMTTWVSSLVERLKAHAPIFTQAGGEIERAFAFAKSSGPPCLECQSHMNRIKGKYGFFWGCQNLDCKKTFPDSRGKPINRTSAKQKQPDENAPKCPKCEVLMVQRQGKPKAAKKASAFWGCSNYPKCKGTLPLVVT